MKHIWGHCLFKNMLLLSVLLILCTKSFASVPWVNTQWISLNSYEVRIPWNSGRCYNPQNLTTGTCYNTNISSYRLFIYAPVDEFPWMKTVNQCTVELEISVLLKSPVYDRYGALILTPPPSGTQYINSSGALNHSFYRYTANRNCESVLNDLSLFQMSGTTGKGQVAPPDSSRPQSASDFSRICWQVRVFGANNTSSPLVANNGLGDCTRPTPEIPIACTFEVSTLLDHGTVASNQLDGHKASATGYVTCTGDTKVTTQLLGNGTTSHTDLAPGLYSEAKVCADNTCSSGSERYTINTAMNVKTPFNVESILHSSGNIAAGAYEGTVVLITSMF